MAQKSTKKRQKTSVRKYGAEHSKVISSSAPDKSSSNPGDEYSLIHTPGKEYDWDLSLGDKVLGHVYLDSSGQNPRLERAYRVQRRSLEKFNAVAREWALHYAPRLSKQISQKDDSFLGNIFLRFLVSGENGPVNATSVLSRWLKPAPAKTPQKKKSKTPSKTAGAAEPEKPEGPRKVKRAEIVARYIGPAFVALRQGFAMTKSLAQEGILNYRRNARDMTLMLTKISEWAGEKLLDVEDLNTLVLLSRLPYCMWTEGVRGDQGQVVSIIVAPPTAEATMRSNQPFSKAFRVTFVRRPPMGDILVEE